MKLKIVQYGVGKMSKYTMRYVFENGWEIIGAFDRNPSKIGIDIGKIIGGNDCNIIIQSPSNFKKFIEEKRPDAVIITTTSLLQDTFESMKICAECGVNAITTCEEAFFPQNSNPKLFEELDGIAKQTNCTITGSGYQDIFWGNLVCAIAGSTHKINKIKGKSSYNVEDYGIALARAHGAGLSIEEFKKTIASSDDITEEERTLKIENGEFLPSYMWNVNGWLASKLNLHITHQTQECIPQIASEKIHSTTLGIDIKQGFATGMSAVVKSETSEGIVMESECIGKVYTKNEYDFNEWTIIGEPTTNLKVDRPSTLELTCATIVNRIPDIIESKCGYITTNELNLPVYKAK